MGLSIGKGCIVSFHSVNYQDSEAQDNVRHARTPMGRFLKFEASDLELVLYLTWLKQTSEYAKHVWMSRHVETSSGQHLMTPQTWGRTWRFWKEREGKPPAAGWNEYELMALMVELA